MLQQKLLRFSFYDKLILCSVVFQWLKKTRRKALFTSLEKMKEGMSVVMLWCFKLSFFFSFYFDLFNFLGRVDVAGTYITALVTKRKMDFRNLC